MKTVKEFLIWKNDNKEKSLEDLFYNEKVKLEWEETDTLYSFLGIYVIGLAAYYPNKFRSTNYSILTERGRNVYSNNFIYDNFEKFVELNESEELMNFINNYLTIGNLFPIWPGGNIHKGKSYCFDIPEIYFCKHKKMAYALIKVYTNSFMEEVIENRNNLELCKLLNMNAEEYKLFLKNVVNTIQKRTHNIKDVLRQNF